jgi:hypothetical protein
MRGRRRVRGGCLRVYLLSKVLVFVPGPPMTYKSGKKEVCFRGKRTALGL